MSVAARQLPSWLIFDVGQSIAVKKKVGIVLAVVIVFLTAAAALGLHFGLLNRGQEFGTYGQYNRVLRVTRETKRYEVLHSALSRRLDWRNLGRLDRFTMRLRDANGKVATLEFRHGSPEMSERDTRTLQEIVSTKFAAAVPDVGRH